MTIEKQTYYNYSIMLVLSSSYRCIDAKSQTDKAHKDRLEEPYNGRPFFLIGVVVALRLRQVIPEGFGTTETLS